MGRISLDRAAKVLVVDGAELELGPVQYRLLEVLMVRSPQWVHREPLGVALWGNDHDRDPSAVRVVVHGLRRSLGPAAAMVQSRYAFGYRVVKAG